MGGIENRGRLTVGDGGLGLAHPDEGRVGAGLQLGLRELFHDAIVNFLRESEEGALVVLQDTIDDHVDLGLKVVGDGANAVQSDGLEDLAHTLGRPLRHQESVTAILGVICEPFRGVGSSTTWL